MVDAEWKQRILKEYDVTAELTTMKSAREAIQKAMGERSAIVRGELPAVEQDIDFAEASVLLAVAARVDEKNKPVGNAETRKAQMTIELATNGDYQIALGSRQRLHARIDNVDATIASEERRYSSAKASLGYKMAALRLLGGGD